MRCLACGIPIPDVLVGVFPCPGCGRPLRRTRLDAAAERAYERRRPPLPGALAWLPGLALAMFLATLGGALLWGRIQDEVGWALLLLLPLCLGALTGYLSPTFPRLAVGLAVSVVALAAVGYLTRIVGFV